MQTEKKLEHILIRLQAIDNKLDKINITEIAMRFEACSVGFGQIREACTQIRDVITQMQMLLDESCGTLSEQTWLQ